MHDFIFGQNGIFIFRILIACLCGAAIGIEREQRVKVAGIKTHIIISMSAALMMIISKYGFFDVLGTSGVSVDVSRVAAGIITGVGILSGGIIFIGKRNNTVSGTTTAAGIWATIGIGMAIGCGLYSVGISAMIIVEIIQVIFHKNLGFLHHIWTISAVFTLEKDNQSYVELEKLLTTKNIKIAGMKWEKRGKGTTVLSCKLQIPSDYDRNSTIDFLSSVPSLTSFEILA